jgi:hypothetical protein
MTSGKLDDACRKLEESKRLDPLPGTLLNVAVCHEQQGRTATAVAEFREAKALAERDQRADRVALADQHLKSLDGKVSSVVIVVPPEADRLRLRPRRPRSPRRSRLRPRPRLRSRRPPRRHRRTKGSRRAAQSPWSLRAPPWSPRASARTSA